MRVIGRKPVLDLLRSDQPVQRVQLATNARGRIIGDILSQAKRRRVRVDRVPPEVVRRSFGGGNHQGVVAHTAAAPLRRLKELEAGIPVRTGLLVALDGVTDPHHLGAIARSALAAGADALLTAARRSAPVGDTALKASAGTLARIPVIEEPNLARALKQLQGAGWWLHGAAGEGSEPLWEHRWDERTVLLMGSEGEGLSRQVRELCDHLVAIPMPGPVESLSVSAAAAVLLLDHARKRGGGEV